MASTFLSAVSAPTVSSANSLDAAGDSYIQCVLNASGTAVAVVRLHVSLDGVSYEQRDDVVIRAVGPKTVHLKSAFKDNYQHKVELVSLVGAATLTATG